MGYTDTWDSVLPRLQEALFGEFVISRELGRGGMAAVFLAHQLKLDRKVAIKVMAPTLMSGLGLVDRFRVEATTVARLDHPNIISIFEVGQATGLQYFVMQYVAGRSLERVLRQYGQLPLSVTQAILFEVGSALAYAHRQQVIHRDVKPGNVLMHLDGRVIVSDFGIAKVAESSAHTQTGAVVGTPAYMSPEQCLGKTLTPAADQYALGIVAYEMLAGAPPFQGTPYTVMRGHTEEALPDLRTLRPDCPPGVVAAIGRMLSKQPADRFSSISAALTALGATRMSIDGVEDMLGHLAVPLPGEEGVIIVHTPASPAPVRAASESTTAAIRDAAPASSEARARQVAAIRAAIARTRQQLARAASTTVAALAAGWQRTRDAARSRAVRTGAAAAGFRGRMTKLPRPSRSVVVGSLGVIVLAAIIAVGLSFANKTGPASEKQIVVADSVRPAPTDSVVLQPTATDTSSGAVVDSTVQADSLTGTESVDSVLVSVDSTAPRSIRIRYAANKVRIPITAGDTVEFDVRGRSLKSNNIRGLRVTWRVSDTTLATINSAGKLITRRPGPVTVSSRMGALADSLVLNVVAPALADRTATSDSGKRDDKAGARDAADIEAVHHAVTQFVTTVIRPKNSDDVRRLYRSSGGADDPELTELLRILRDQKDVRARPQGNPPPPSIAGNTARAVVQIGIDWDKFRGRSSPVPMKMTLDLTRFADGWQVAGFSLSKPGA